MYLCAGTSSGCSLSASSVLLVNAVDAPGPERRRRPLKSNCHVVGPGRLSQGPCRTSISISQNNNNKNNTPTTKCQAVGESSSEAVVYQGVYGPWTIQPSDVQEVILYRSGLVTAAASFVLASSTAFLPDDSALGALIKTNLELFCALGASGLGLSLYLIHIYVSEIKRTLQALWLLGAFGSLASYASFAQPAGKNLVQYVIENPTAIWFVGPLFAALTGLVFKEGAFSNTS